MRSADTASNVAPEDRDLDETFIIRYTPVDYRERRMRAVSLLGGPSEEQGESLSHSMSSEDAGFSIAVISVDDEYDQVGWGKNEKAMMMERRNIDGGKISNVRNEQLKKEVVGCMNDRCLKNDITN